MTFSCHDIFMHATYCTGTPPSCEFRPLFVAALAYTAHVGGRLVLACMTFSCHDIFKHATYCTGTPPSFGFRPLFVAARDYAVHVGGKLVSATAFVAEHDAQSSNSHVESLGR